MQTDRGPLKLAVVGCGMITESAHLPAALASTNIEVVALVDPDFSRATKLAAKYGIEPQISDNLDGVLSTSDAVLIATPNHTHFPLAKHALAERKAVLVEKPLTNTYAEAVELCELAERNETVLATGFVSRHRESVVLFKELLDSGVLGRIRGFNYQFGTAGGVGASVWIQLAAQPERRRGAGRQWHPLSRSHAVLLWLAKSVCVRRRQPWRHRSKLPRYGFILKFAR